MPKWGVCTPRVHPILGSKRGPNTYPVLDPLRLSELRRNYLFSALWGSNPTPKKGPKLYPILGHFGGYQIISVFRLYFWRKWGPNTYPVLDPLRLSELRRNYLFSALWGSNPTPKKGPKLYPILGIFMSSFWGHFGVPI